MNTRELLIEATYDLGHSVDQIYRGVIEPVVIQMKAGKRVKVQAADIKPYLNKIIEKYTKADYDIDLYFRQTEKPSLEFLSHASGTPAQIIMELNLVKTKIKNLNKMEIKREIEKSLTHELTHVIDMLKSKNKSPITKDYYDPYKYVSNKLEFNAFFHEIKNYIKSNKKKWNKIRSMEEFRDILLSVVANLADVLKTNPNGYKNLERKFLERLARENLLPKDMITKFDAY